VFEILGVRVIVVAFEALGVRVVVAGREAGNAELDDQGYMTGTSIYPYGHRIK